MSNTLRFRLFLSYVLLTAVILLVAGLTLAVAWQGVQDRIIQSRLATSVPLTTRLVRELWRNKTPFKDIALELSEPLKARNARLLLVRRGRIVGDSADNQWLGTPLSLDIPLPRLRKTTREPITGVVTGPDGQTYLYALMSLFPPKSNATPGSPPLIVLQISPRRFPNVVQEIGKLLMGAAFMALVAGLAFSWFISRWITRPLTQIAQAADKIAQGDLEFQLQISGPAEVEHVAQQFNHMAAEVRASRQAQQAFIANVSHDLKTPLTIIQGFAQALVEGVADDPETIRRATQAIHHESLRMGCLVEQLLDLARLESGQMQFRRDPINLKEIVAETVDHFQPLAKEKGVVLSVLGDDVLVLGDRDRLMQVCTNLLDNALRHTPTGGLVVCRVERTSDVRGMAALIVQDTGPGIPTEEMDRIFERFYQVDKSRRGGSAGLGLAIVSEIVRAHQGRVEVTSKPGEGARFRVLLPIASTLIGSDDASPH